MPRVVLRYDFRLPPMPLPPLTGKARGAGFPQAPDTRNSESQGIIDGATGAADLAGGDFSTKDAQGPGTSKDSSEGRWGALAADSATERKEKLARIRRRFDRLQRFLVWLDWGLAAAVLGWGIATEQWLWVGLGVLGLALAAVRPGERLSALLLRTFVRKA